MFRMNYSQFSSLFFAPILSAQMDLNQRLEAIANEASCLQDDEEERSFQSEQCHTQSFASAPDHVSIHTDRISNNRSNENRPAPVFFIGSSSETTSLLAENPTSYCTAINRFLTWTGLSSEPLLPVYVPPTYTITSLVSSIQFCLLPSLISNVVTGQGPKVAFLFLLIVAVYVIFNYDSVSQLVASIIERFLHTYCL